MGSDVSYGRIPSQRGGSVVPALSGGSFRMPSLARLNELEGEGWDNFVGQRASSASRARQEQASKEMSRVISKDGPRGITKDSRQMSKIAMSETSSSKNRRGSNLSVKFAEP